MKMHINRRRYPRYTMVPAYTAVSVRTLDREGQEASGHAYDVSEGGVRFELDEALEPGTKVAMELSLPSFDADEAAPPRGIFAMATIVRTEDEDEPGPVRTAAIFTSFARPSDRERLLRQFATGRYRLAA